MKTQLPYKTFNLFFAYDADVPFVERVYKWITSVGRYIVIGVEMVVLSAFIARFILDQNLNDLTDKVNDNDKLIVSFRDQENKFRRTLEKTDVSKEINDSYKSKLLDEISKVYSLAPAGVTVVSVDYSNNISDVVNAETLSVNVSSLTNLAPDYENILTQNILNPDKVLPNPNISLKLLNVSSSSGSDKGYTFTFKITRLI